MENGMFVDVIARVATVDNDLKVDSTFKGGMDSTVFGLSGEAGWRLAVNDMFFVEPQVELTYAYVNSDDFSLSSARYSVDSTKSLTTRAGFLAGIDCPNKKGSAYLKASAVHEFLGDAAITGVSQGSAGVYETDGKDTWFEFGVGGHLNVTDAVYVWADLERTQGASLDEDWRASLGVRYSF